MFETFTNSDLITAKLAINTANEEWEAAYKKIQAACPHEKLGEVPSREGFDSHIQAERVCFQCGISEQSYFGKYKLLTNPFHAVITNEVMRVHRVGPYYDHRLVELRNRNEAKAVKET